MFDNGNFRRKRRRRAEQGGPAKARDESLKPAGAPALLGLEPRASPAGAERGPCFSRFTSGMSAAARPLPEDQQGGAGSCSAAAEDSRRGPAGAACYGPGQPLPGGFSVSGRVYGREGTEV